MPAPLRFVSLVLVTSIRDLEFRKKTFSTIKIETNFYIVKDLPKVCMMRSEDHILLSFTLSTVQDYSQISLELYTEKLSGFIFRDIFFVSCDDSSISPNSCVSV